MKASTATLLLCAGLAAGISGAAQAQTATYPAPPPAYSHDLYGDWKVSYAAPAAKSSDQVAAELAQSKANGQYTFGEEDYPPRIAGSQTETRAQVEQELQQAEAAGIMASDEEDYPPTAMAHSGTAAMH